jgi:thiosulfate/3-mercaptopyruvate sulfurtransferase
MTHYPNGEILIEVDWLKQHLGDPHLRILDVRASDPRLPIGYRMGHIPGAIALEPTRELVVSVNGAPEVAASEKVAQAFAQRGISNETPVIIYDEWTGPLVALTFWVMRYIGHRDVRILHGGWTLWRNAGGATTNDIPQFVPAEYRAQPNGRLRATAEWIQANAARSGVFLLDARSSDEYAMGHIPGAVNLSYDSGLIMETQTFKDAATLRAQLEAVGATPDKEIVAYCSAGARSAHIFIALQLLGYPRVRNYEGSWTDWHHARGLPVEE